VNGFIKYDMDNWFNSEELIDTKTIINHSHFSERVEVFFKIHVKADILQ
jgi:hypothetical protein